MSPGRKRIRERVLVIDDISVYVNWLKNISARMLRVEAVHHGERGLESRAGGDHSLVVLDVIFRV